METIIFSSAEEQLQEPIEDIGSRQFVMALRKLILSTDAYEELQLYIIEHADEAPKSRSSTGRAHPKYHLIGKLVEKGLRADEQERSLATARQAAQEARTLLRAMSSIELGPRPCPSNVAQTWWTAKEEERLRRAHEALLQGVRECLTILGRIGK